MRIEITVKIVPDGTEAVTVAVPIVHQTPPPLCVRAEGDWFASEERRRKEARRRARQEARAHEDH